MELWIRHILPWRQTRTTTVEDEVTKVVDTGIDSIILTSKVTRSGRVFSAEISPKTIDTPVRVTTTESTIEARGKEKIIEPAEMEAPKEVIAEDTSRQEMDKVLKIIRKSDFNIVE